MANKHTAGKHALLSASASERWLNCTPSVRLSERYGIKRTTKYNEEGTVAHDLAETKILYELGRASKATTTKGLNRLQSSKYYSNEMAKLVDRYVDYVLESYAEALTYADDAIIEIEDFLDYSTYVREGFGRCDKVIATEGYIDITDYKHGAGIPVSVEGNTQMRLYSLGALFKYDLLFNIEEVRYTVYQPRANNIATEVLPVSELTEWANSVVVPAAKLAYEGIGECNSGAWCRFCPVKGRCKSLASVAVALEKYNFKDPRLLSDVQLAKVLVAKPRLAAWLAAVEDEAQQLLEDGKELEGFTLKNGVQSRKIIDEHRAIEILTQHGYKGFTNTSLKSIAELEKILEDDFNLLDEVLGYTTPKTRVVPVNNTERSIAYEDANNAFNT